MRKLFIIPALALCVGALGFQGCADSSGGSEKDTSGIDVSTDAANGDASQPDGSTSDTGVDVAKDTAPVDPCDPNPCAVKAPTCEGAALTTYAEPDCQDEDGTANCVYAETTVDCAEGTTCAGGACVEAGDPQDYVFSENATVMTSLAIGGVSDAEPCCFDFTDDGEMDNALGKLLNGLGNILGDTDVNAEITSNMQSGSLVILLEHQGLDIENLANDNDVNMSAFYGEDGDDDYSDNLAGTGNFKVDSASFVEGTKVPKAHFPGSKIEGGVLYAGPSIFNLAFPIGNIKLNAVVSGTLIEAAVSVGPNKKGLAVDNGKLGGYIKMADLYAALNAYVAGSCECLGIDGELIAYNDEKGKMACASVENSSCDSNDPDQDTCAQFSSFCGAALLFLKADVDSDDDGEKDAMSVGAWFSGTSANITGLADVPPDAQ